MVIPSINCPNFREAEKKIRQAESFLPTDGRWIHVDVSDGKFSDTVSWGSPEELKSLNTDLNIEVHLMVENPDRVIEDWLTAGVKRLIVHLQAMRDPRFILDTCKRYGAEAMLSFDPTISEEEGLPYINDFHAFHILTVFPGPSGQEKQQGWTRKVEFLREKSPTAIIEVDGGMNPEDIQLAINAGANAFAVGNYIFGNPNPKGAYEKLRALYKKSA